MIDHLVLPISLLPVRLTAVCALIAGLIYFFKRSPMAYHQKYLETPFATLPKTSQGLILALLHATGSGLIAIGVTLGYIAWVPLPARSPEALTTALVLVISTMVPMTVVTFSLGRYTPWWLILGLGAASVAGLWWFAAS